MKLVLSLLLVGCDLPGPEPCTERCPHIDGISPDTGDYGTAIAIDGEFIGGGSVAFDGVECPMPPESASDTEIVVRVPFPASGNVFVNLGNQRLGAGTFTPTTPAPTPEVRATGLFDARMLASGDVVAIYRQDITGGSPRMVIFGTGARSYSLSEVGIAPLSAVVVAGDEPEAIVGDASDRRIFQLVIEGDQLVKRASGLDGRVIAAGRDGDQTVAWIETLDDMLVRVRVGDPPWEIDRGPFAWPTSALAATIAIDGSLVAALDSGGLVMQRAAATLAPPEPVAATAGTSARIAVMPGDAEQMALGSEGLYRRDASGAWTTVEVSESDPVFGFTATGLSLAVASEPTGGVTLIPDVDAPDSVSVLPVWPAQIDALVPGTDGTLRTLVTTCERAYLLD